MLPIITIIGSLVVILALLRFKVNIGMAMFLGALINVLGGGLGLEQAWETLYKSVIDPVTIELALTIMFITGLGNIMGKTGILRQLIDSLQRLFRDTRLILIALPSLIGMLMVPGGAILSAPLVQEVGQRHKMEPAKMVAANMMFRHMWYLIFPLFPTMIMASQLSEVSPISIVIFNLPLMLIAFIATFIMLFRNQKDMHNGKYQGWDPQALYSLLRSVLPMLIAIVLALGLGIYFPLAIFVGVLVVFFYQWQEERLSPVVFARKFMQSVNWGLVLAIFAIMYFKDVLAAAGGVELIASYLIEQGISLLPLLIVVPFLGGFVTGSNVANIGIAFPLFLPLLPVEGREIYVAFMFTMSVQGYLVSPIHLCLILTREHFRCSLGATYRYFLIPPVLVMVAGTLLFLLLTGF